MLAIALNLDFGIFTGGVGAIHAAVFLAGSDVATAILMGAFLFAGVHELSSSGDWVRLVTGSG
jgi:hypothetical protein